MSKPIKLRLEIEAIRKTIMHGIQEDKYTLELEKEKLIKGQVLSDCTVIEEAMSVLIMDYILKDSKKWKEIDYFGRIKRFLLLYDEILGHIPPFQKLNIVRKIIRIPKKIENTTLKVFNLRNVFSHSFTLDYTKRKRILYDGVSILNPVNFEKYFNDSVEAKRFFIKRAKIV